jgi:hypothetical protein
VIRRTASPSAHNTRRSWRDTVTGASAHGPAEGQPARTATFRGVDPQEPGRQSWIDRCRGERHVMGIPGKTGSGNHHWTPVNRLVDCAMTEHEPLSETRQNPSPGRSNTGFSRWMFGARPADHAVLRWLEWPAFRLAMITLFFRVGLGPGTARDVLAILGPALLASSLLAEAISCVTRRRQRGSGPDAEQPPAARA